MIDGKQQKVESFQWDGEAEPEWKIRIDGSDDQVFEVMCSNSPNLQYEVVKWDIPKFRDENGKDISDKFNPKPPTKIDRTKARYEWNQEYVGQYNVSLSVKVKYTPARPGRKPKEVQVRNGFKYIITVVPEEAKTKK